DRGRRERDHDEQGHDPCERAGVHADDLVGAPALGLRVTVRGSSGDRADRRGRGGPAARGGCRGAVHRARRRVRAFDDPDPCRGGPGVRSARHAVYRGGGVPDYLRLGRGAQRAVRLRVPASERPPLRRARCGHREDQLAGGSGLVRQAGRSRERDPSRARRRVTAGGCGAPEPHGTGDGGGSHRVLGRPEHLHASLTGGHHAGVVAGHPGGVVGGQGARGARRGDRRWVVRAAFMTGVNAVEVRDAEDPKLDPRGAVLRVEACGICGTDARTFFNGDPRAPVPWLLGHEPVGILEEVGPEADLPPGIGKGDRVFLGSILTCGECRWCVDGFQNLCEHHLLYGYDPFPGAYADLAAVPPIATKNLIKLPPQLPSDLATTADPFACALNGIEVLDVRLGDTVMILGTGPIGCWQAVMARDRGAGRIFLTDVNGDRLQVALGVVGHLIDDAWVAGEDNGVAEVLSRTDGRGADRVSVAAPSKAAQQAALEMAAKRARVVYFAGLPKHDPVSPLDMNQLHYKELAVLGAYGATHRQYRITMGYLDRRQEDLGRVVTHRFSLEHIDQAFETIRSGAGLKMVILP